MWFPWDALTVHHQLWRLSFVLSEFDSKFREIFCFSCGENTPPASLELEEEALCHAELQLVPNTYLKAPSAESLGI